MPNIKANGINLYYETHGQGQPIVFVAGFSGDHTVWLDIIDQYSKNYQVIIFDNRGIGKSACPDYPYTTEMFADDTAELIKALNLGPVHIIGGSYGGCIAQNVIYKYPELIKSAVLTNTGANLNIRAKLYIQIRLELMQAGAPEKSILKFISMLCWSQKYLSQPGQIEDLVQQGFFPISEQGYKNQAHGALTFDSTNWLKEIKVPCLVLGSDDDVLVTTSQAEFLANNIPESEYYCFHDVGHVPQVEQTEIFNQLIHSFIKKYT